MKKEEKKTAKSNKEKESKKSPIKTKVIRKKIDKTINNLKKINKKTIILLIIALILIIATIFTLITSKESLSVDDISDKVLKYIDESYFNGEASLEITDVIIESGIYKITIFINGTEFETYATRDGKLFFPEGSEIIFNKTIGNFKKIEDDPCYSDDGKLLVYYFGSSDCPYCEWQKPVIEAALLPFENQVSFKNNTDNENDLDIFSKYSDGSIPLIVIGCNYYRVGAGINSSEQEDIDVISSLVCSMIDGNSNETCEDLEELINKI
jgi:thiol-disulfide isomerase/thioredoxin